MGSMQSLPTRRNERGYNSDMDNQNSRGGRGGSMRGRGGRGRGGPGRHSEPRYNTGTTNNNNNNYSNNNNYQHQDKRGGIVNGRGRGRGAYTYNGYNQSRGGRGDRYKPRGRGDRK